jgi:DNA helicase TIP49 (TBP-interacting protein)
MGSANRRLMRYKHLYDRISEILKFEPFSKKDISRIIDELSEVEMTDCAKNLIFTKTNRFRQIVKLINKAEQIAKSNGINSIDETTLKEFINDEVANQDAELNFENSTVS